MDRSENKIAIIGLGHMGYGLYRGLKKGGSKNIILSENSECNIGAFEQADWIFLAVKPNKVAEVLEKIPIQSKEKLLISLAAGIKLKQLKQSVKGKNIAVTRIMPSLAVQAGTGIIGLYSGGLKADDLKEKLLLLGDIVEVSKEKDLDILTIISGCAPAILAYFGQSFANFSSKSEKIILKSLIGSLKYIEESGLTFKEVIQAVATKGGITENILSFLDSKNTKRNIESALESGYNKLQT